MPRLDLPALLRAQLEHEARAAWPAECCGLIEGVRGEDTVNILALHPMRNLSPDADRFEIDPSEHIRLLRDLRGTGREIVGCYHSHPNGRAEPSARDCANEDGFIWLIAARDAQGSHSPSAYVPERGAWRRLELNDLACAT